MQAADDGRMAKTRALLTETEREQIAGEHGPDRKYQATSRVRSRIRDELGTDVGVLEDHQTELLGELRETVCEDVHAGEHLSRVETALTDAEAAMEQQDGDGIADALKTAQGALQDAQEVSNED